MRRTVPLLLALAGSVLLARPASATDGFLDSRFWTDGKIFWSESPGYHTARAVVTAPDGRLALLGERPTPSGTRGFWRWVADSSYSPVCLFEPVGGATTSYVGAAAFDAQGRLLVAGLFGTSGSLRVAVARYLYPGCTLDTTFSGDGVWWFAVPDADALLSGIAVLPDGRIVVAGTAAIDDGQQTDYDLFVALLTDTGLLDPAFSGDGWLALDPTGFGFLDAGTGLALDPAGRILVAGQTELGGDYDWVVVALDESGALDPSFSGDGIAWVSFDLGGAGHSDDFAPRIALDPNGRRIVVAGSAETATGWAWAVARLLPAGTLDPAFSGDGKASSTLGGEARLTGVAVDGWSRVVAGGEVTDGSSNTDFLGLRLTAAGVLDSSFHGVGYNRVAFDLGGGNEIDDRGEAMTLQAGRPVIVGQVMVDTGPGFDYRVAAVRLGTDLIFADAFESDSTFFWSSATGAP